MKVWQVGLLGLVLCLWAARAQEPVPLGDEFQVNTYTTSSQVGPALAADAQGNFVVVWQGYGSYGTDTSDTSIQGQRYDANGTPVGGQFQVNSYTTDIQRSAAVSADPQGNFIVVWESYGSHGTDTSDTSVQAQFYDASGSPVGGQFQVNSYTTDIQRSASVFADPQGNIIVVWESYGSHGTDANGFSVQAQLFDADGTPVGGQFQVNSYTTSRQYEAAVAADAQGNFVVAWLSYGSYGTDADWLSVQARRHDASGTPMGGQFQVNTYTTSWQWGPAVAADAQGNIAVVWQSYGSHGTDTDRRSIQAQFYDASGTPVGGQFQVNTYTTSYQRGPTVAADPHGHFVVAWQSYGSYGTDSDEFSVQAQFYDASGTPVGGQFQVNTYTTSWQWEPAVAADAQGNFVMAWQSHGSYGTDRSGQSIQGQRYSTGGIFVDGLESGDCSSWSFEIPPP